MIVFKIDKPCSENWENMQDIPEGKFCDLCQKKVLDLTQKTNDEIFQLLDVSNGTICGKIFKDQSNQNFKTPVNPIIPREKRKSYSRIVAGLTIAASLTGIQTHATTTITSSIEILESQDKNDNEEAKISNEDFIISGKLMNSETGKPLENIEVTFITTEKIFTGKTSKDGIYKLSVPNFYIQKKNNLLHINFGGYNDKEYLLTKDELKKKEFSFKGSEINEVIIVAGGISKRKLEPTILLDGEEITEKEFYDLNLQNFKVFRFYGKTAKAILNDTSDDGLFLVFSK